MANHFIKYAQDAQRFTESLAKDLGCAQDYDKTRRILKAVLHTLRDRITIAESLQLLAQLPTLLKGIYVENWKYSQRPQKFRTTASLTEALRESEHLAKPEDFPNESYAIFAVNMVFKNLAHYVSRGELEDVIAQLPAEIKTVIDLNIESHN